MIGPDRGRRSELPETPHTQRRRPGAGLEPRPVSYAGPCGGAGRVSARRGSVASVDLDLAGLGQHVDDVGLKVSVMHSGLPELARVPVILPVMVPVAPTVGPEPVHVHLQRRAVAVTPRRERGGQDAGEPRVVTGEDKGAAANR